MTHFKQHHKKVSRMTLQVYLVFLTCLVCIGFNGLAFSADDASDLWDALKSGDHVALLRHALAPGTGDPADFRLDHCATQRNLSDIGRDQAVRIGDQFRENNIFKARIFSSQWCRCLDTAKLLGLGQIEALALLNSFFRQYERRDSQTNMLRQWLKEQKRDGPMVLVTHQVNITALSGIYPDSGELVIIRLSESGKIEVIGTIKTRSRVTGNQ